MQEDAKSTSTYTVMINVAYTLSDLSGVKLPLCHSPSMWQCQNHHPQDDTRPDPWRFRLITAALSASWNYMKLNVCWRNVAIVLLSFTWNEFAWHGKTVSEHDHKWIWFWKRNLKDAVALLYKLCPNLSRTASRKTRPVKPTFHPSKDLLSEPAFCAICGSVLPRSQTANDCDTSER